MHFSRPAPNTQNKVEPSKDTVIQQMDTIYTPSKTESKKAASQSHCCWLQVACTITLQKNKEPPPLAHQMSGL
jgi:hypothetical protein